MTLIKKDWLDLRDILTCALDSDMPIVEAMIRERKTGKSEKILDKQPWFV